MKLFNFSNKRVYWIETDKYFGYSFYYKEPYGFRKYTACYSYSTSERCEVAAIEHYKKWLADSIIKSNAGKFIKEINYE